MKLSLQECVPGRNTNAEAFEHIYSVWHTMETFSRPSYFLSWGWVKNWLSSLPNDVALNLAVLYDRGLPVCAFFLGKRDLVRHGVLKSRGLFLNTTGLPLVDKLHIEYNSILGFPLIEAPLKRTLEQLNLDWEELHMPALDAKIFPALTRNLTSYRVIVNKTEPSFYVDLKQANAAPGGYLSLLSRNTRSQIRRAYRAYQAIGKISIHVASDLHTAWNFFHELMALHQKVWHNRGQSGAFTTDYFKNFHKNLIRDRFDTGEIQLLRVSVGNETLGCLYNFVYEKKVLFYQSGINYKPNPHMKPGLLSHSEAIAYNAKAGNLEYDFLGGNEQFKKSLSTGHRTLIWARVQKPRIKFQIEGMCKNLIRRLHIPRVLFRQHV
jgi:CelD/BcsL family acetyltransferase involved in cellulose biosynthesis